MINPVGGSGAEVMDVAAELAAAGVGDVRADTLTRGMYSSDASIYRIVPRVVVFPRDEAEVAAALDVARRTGTPFTARGGGTSIAGNAIGTGMVLDFTRHMGRVLDIDAEAGTARVQPGTIHAALQRQVVPLGWRFGPDPSSHTRCAIGGMIGNNACGNRAVGYGRTSDNITALVALTGRGERFSARTGVATVGGARGGASPRPTVIGADGVVEAARAAVAADLECARTEFARFGRQVSGYAVEHLLPENGLDIGRFLVGSEGTLAIVTEATVRLVKEPAATVLVVLGYPSFGEAGDAAPHLRRPEVVAAEGIDRRIVDIVIAKFGAAAVPELPRGGSWLMVEVIADSRAQAQARARTLVAEVEALDHRIVSDPGEARALWRIREDGAGLSGRSPQGRPAHAGWEDAAVPPARLGAYLREFDALLTSHGLSTLPYGHFGDGCLHARIDFPLDRPGGTRAYRRFMLEAADLVAAHGGSLSGEHGDGRARGELLPRMYSPTAMALFGRLKHAFDPDNLLNPGVIVDPDPTDSRIRVSEARRFTGRLAFDYAGDGGNFAQAVHRCTGVGKCRADGPAGVMCPSYRATREEKDSTRGRARVLEEMVNGSLVTGGWRAAEVHDALDLCLSCKGCASDCPTGIDMATYKSEVLHQAYRRRLRPRTHYSLGWLPRWTRLASGMPTLANLALTLPGLKHAALALAGVDVRRGMPRFAKKTFRALAGEVGVPVGQALPGSQAVTPIGGSAAGSSGSVAKLVAKPVVIFADSFSDAFDPGVGGATVDVLRGAGYDVSVTGESVCCGLTWITTGQLDAAKRILRRTIAALHPLAVAGVPIVGLEPSCTAVLRHDAVELLGTQEARDVAAATVTLAELLTGDPDYTPPSLAGVQVVAQPHCHHHAILGWGADEALLQAAGAQVTRLGGCCGLAGNFGVEHGHYEVSVAVAEDQLLPAVRAADPHTVILADGFSCRTQLADLAPRTGIHLAQLLADPRRRR
ncbi:FAD/FMN-containing dehydrogenase/Fe-S oxidoreductase [Kineosphaera limosa]|uniref:Putative FAD-linked oxidase n=1 Tax=Kineosphaera limosa NBRC 100340 TaxID=1184609 RepID=K6VLE9_9MICO|nr:FAD-binding and (Fe-S)-binding domain-containing protein [Kineosphaera limosa]NYD99302.1 FAD/FMN-containing dehydrogenase/Fe-S oxidoreductase [Kineosphaera limosa]GAB97048.1 putative FAD-linked oxidase [Kineosphaera limosa NBRC 100340]